MTRRPGGTAGSASRALLAPLAALVLATAISPAATARADDASPAAAATPVAASPVGRTDDLDVADARVVYLEALDLLLFEIEVKGKAGGTAPRARGTLNGAPVVAYLFPTTLRPEDVGFAPSEGSVALAVAAHPDFDDTPLWDEDGSRKYDDDGATWHAHWWLLAPDKRVPGELRVEDLHEPGSAAVKPPTAPEIRLLLDSPGFPVRLHGSELQVLVPAKRVAGRKDFRFDAMTAYLQMSTAAGTPMLGVYEVYDSLSGNAKPRFDVKRR